MTRFLKAAGQAIAVGLWWSLAAAMVALAIEASIDPYGEIVDVWVAVLIGGLTDPHGPPPWRLLGLVTGVMMLAMAIAAPVTVMFAGKVVEALRESEEWQALWK